MKPSYAEVQDLALFYKFIAESRASAARALALYDNSLADAKKKLISSVKLRNLPDGRVRLTLGGMAYDLYTRSVRGKCGAFWHAVSLDCDFLPVGREKNLGDGTINDIKFQFALNGKL